MGFFSVECEFALTDPLNPDAICRAYSRRIGCMFVLLGGKIMSKISIAILFAAIGLISLGAYFDVPYVAGGSGLILVVGLCYAYVVAKREMARVADVIREEKQRLNTQSAKPAPRSPEPAGDKPLQTAQSQFV